MGWLQWKLSSEQMCGHYVVLMSFCSNPHSPSEHKDRHPQPQLYWLYLFHLFLIDPHFSMPSSACISHSPPFRFDANEQHFYRQCTCVHLALKSWYFFKTSARYTVIWKDWEKKNLSGYIVMKYMISADLHILYVWKQ